MGDREIERSGDREIGRSGDREIERSGDREIERSRDREIERSGDREIGRLNGGENRCSLNLSLSVFHYRKFTPISDPLTIFFFLPKVFSPLAG
jgi:hypothetical protein